MRNHSLKQKISIIEWVLIALVSLAILVGLTITAGGPRFSDELAYITAGMLRLKDTHILNRYFHVYLQAIFMALAPTALIGVKLFWAGEMVATACMIYFGIRLLNPRATWIHSILATFFFFSLPLFPAWSGATIVDLTSMVVVTAILFFYLLSVRFEKASRWFLMAMGAMLFFALKTKELNMVLGFMLLGVGLDERGVFRWKTLWKKVRWFLLGMVAGTLVFMLLSWMIVKDPLWGFRISEFQVYFKDYAQGFFGKYEPVPYDYLKVFLSTLPLFLLYLLGGFYHGERIGSRERFIWYAPWVIVIAITVSMAQSPTGTMDRLMYPALPVMCMFVPQCLVYDLPKEKKERIFLAMAIGSGMLIVAGVLLLYPLLARAWGWDAEVFAGSFLLDILVCLLLIVLFSVKKYNKITFALALTAVVLTTAQPFQKNFRQIVVERVNQNDFIMRVAPFSNFKTLIHYTPSMKMLVSADLHTSSFTLGRDFDEIVGLFELYFDQPATRENFRLAGDRDVLLSELLTGPYDYVLMNNNDWNSIAQQQDTRVKIAALYEVRSNDTGKIYFLEKKAGLKSP
jgi:hypothetical protein